jgi:ABC-type glycerol-3-phosphate transport system substrate-binding protein
MKQGTQIIQIALLVFFGIAVVVAMLIFSGKISLGGGSSQQSIKGSLTVWGTLPFASVAQVITSVNTTYKDVRIEYVEKDEKTFQANLVNALASGVGPDIVFISPSDVIVNHDRLVAVPFTALPEALFKDTFIDQASLYLDSTGTLSFPFIVNPLVMFYNRDMLSSSFIVAPPKTWEEVLLAAKKITVKDDAGNLSVQTIALGSFDNITHAKDLLVMLMNQTGKSLIGWDPVEKKYISRFSTPDATGSSGVVNALNFYTSFSNTADDSHYSWNPTLPNDRDQFLSGKLAFYFGYGSEVADLRKKNPNLNFGVTMVPQRKNASTKAVYGKMTGVSILKMSPNQAVALPVAQAMVSQDAINAYLAADPRYAPARKDMLAQPPEDAILTTIYNSAIISKSFLDPDPEKTSALFKKFIDQIHAGLARSEDILSPGNLLITDILEKVQKK